MRFIVSTCLVAVSLLVSACSDEEDDLQSQEELIKQGYNQSLRFINQKVSDCYFGSLEKKEKRGLFYRLHCDVDVPEDIQPWLSVIIRSYGFACNDLYGAYVQSYSEGVHFYARCGGYQYRMEDYGGNIIVTPIR